MAVIDIVVRLAHRNHIEFEFEMWKDKYATENGNDHMLTQVVGVMPFDLSKYISESVDTIFPLTKREKLTKIVRQIIHAD